MSKDDKKVEVVTSQEALTKDEMAEVISSSIKEGMKAGMALASQLASPPKAAQPAGLVRDVNGKVVAYEKCGLCRQPIIACQSKHKDIVVYPQRPELGKDFPGVQLNGEVYRSESPGKLVTVPADSDIESIVAQWEKGEIKMRSDSEKNSIFLAPVRLA